MRRVHQSMGGGGCCCVFFPFAEGMKMRSTKQEPNGNSKANKTVSGALSFLCALGLVCGLWWSPRWQWIGLNDNFSTYYSSNFLHMGMSGIGYVLCQCAGETTASKSWFLLPCELRGLHPGLPAWQQPSCWPTLSFITSMLTHSSYCNP